MKTLKFFLVAFIAVSFFACENPDGPGTNNGGNTDDTTGTETPATLSFSLKYDGEEIKDGDVIMLDASTTAYCIVPHLVNFKNIFVITNGAKTAIELVAMGIKTISPKIIATTVSQFSRSVVSHSLQPHEPQPARPPCPSSTPGIHPNSSN